MAWLTLKEYAAKYAVHENTARKWVGERLIVIYRVGRTVRLQDAPPSTTPLSVPARPARRGHRAPAV